MNSLRRILSIGLSFAILITLLPSVSAATTLNVNSFTIDSSTTPVTVSPGDTININSNVWVSGGNATNIGFHLDTPASGFTYSGGADTLLWWTAEISNIALGLFNPPTDEDAPLTNSGNASDGDFIDILNIRFTVDSAISTYSNSFSANFFSDETTGPSSSNIVYVNVKPHITSASFSPTAIPNNSSGSTTLTLEVKDFNGCSNIDSATITADLTALGGSYTTTEALSYVSCNGVTNTATYQKTGIVTGASAGSASISLSATDEDGNVNDPDDVNFGSIDVSPSSLNLTINDASAPTVTTLAAGDDYIGGATQTSTTISWTGSADTEEYKVVIGDFSDCSGGTIVVDWTAGGNGGVGGITVNASALAEGANTIYVCGAKTSQTLIGSASMLITKDTTPAVLQKLIISPGSVVSGNTSFNWQAGETGTYATRINAGGEIGSTAYSVANQQESTVFVNASLDPGVNTIYIYFYDEAGNQTIISGNVSKTTPPPSMAGQVGTLTDTDGLYNAIDGRDFTVTWNAATYAYFGGYWIYILPQGTALNTGSHAYVSIAPSIGTTTWTGNSMITTDSAGNPFAAGNYIAYVLIRSSAGQNGTAGVSSVGNITSDVVDHPTLDSAEFISDTELQLLYDIDLSTTIADHDATNILSQDFTVTPSCNGNSNGVKSVNGKYMIVCIDSLATQEGSTAAGLAKTSTVIGQIDSLIPANVEIGDTFQFTATGSAATASFVATATTVSNVTAGLTSAINSADFSDIVAGGLTAEDMTTYVKVYATNFNTAFTSDLTVSDGGGLDTQTLMLRRNMEDAIRSDGSGYNCHVSAAIDSNMVGCLASDVDKGVTDGQKPAPLTIGDLVIGGTIYANDDVDLAFSATGITVNFTVPEQLNTNSRIKLEATGGVADINAPHTLLMGSYLTPGNHQVVLNVADLLSDSGTTTTDILNSGTTYQLYIQAYDAAGNSNQSNFKTNLRFDNTAPSIPVTIHFPNQAGTNGQHTNDSTPLLQWFSSTDNASASGGIVYNLDLSVFNDFSANTQTFTNVSGTSQELGALVSDSTYYWRVNAEDEAGNASEYQSTTEYFVFDSTAPVITSPTLTDTDLTSTTYTKDGDNVVLTMTLTDTNRDVITASMITADLSSLGGGAAVNPATYVGGTGVATWTGATVTCTDGVKSIPIDAVDLAGNNAIQVNATITCDNTAPVLAAGTITSPNGAENWIGGSTHDITWTTTDITETNLASLTLQYSDDNAATWNDIATGEANDGTYSWTLPNLNTAQNLVRLIAIDQVTQTGSDVSNATFIIDSTNPTITANTLTAPNGGEYLIGGASTTITWNSAAITDTYLRANPITLEYYNGSAWVEIANTEANDGTYTWNPIPSLNIANAQVRIIAYDIAGNTATDTSDAVFTIDSILPSVSSAQTQDLDGDGQIDAVKFTFTENILDSSVTASDFDIAGFAGEAFTATTNGDVADNDVIYITFTESGSVDSGNTPNYTFTQNTLTDFAGNLMSTIGATATTDFAKPVVVSRVTQDSNADGQLDGVLVTFSENMDASATNSTDFNLITEVANPLTETYSDTTDDTTLLLGFSDGASFDTGDLTQAQLSGTFADLAGNALTAEGSFTSATDGANPIFAAATWIATTTPAVRVTFSEEVDSASDDFSDWAVAGFTVTAMDSLDGTTTSTLLSLNTNITDTSITPNVTYTADDVVDTTGNSLQTATVTASDSLAPTVSSIEIHDLDSDGSLETAYIQFTENVDDSTLTVAGFTLGSVTADNFSTDAFGTNTADDNLIAISLNTGIEGTIVQNVLYTSSIGGMTDLATTPNTIQNVATGDVIEQDKAGPALLSAIYNDNGTAGDASDDAITLIFSEDLDDATLDTGAGNSDLEFTVASGGDITNATTTSGTVDDEILVINLNAGDTALTVGASTVALISAVIADSAANTNTNTAAVTINGSVVINEVMWMGTTLDAADEFIELRNMSASPVDISGWVIQNAANGGDLTIPALSTIPGDGYFLIANFAAGSSQLAVAPDWVTTTLDLADSSNGDLILIDGAVTMDSAEGDTWPAGDGVNYYSMERDLAPGNGLTAGNWHTGDAQTNWDGGATEKGTPGAANVSDAQAPSFQLVTPDSRMPANNSLYPNQLPYISVKYADNVGGSGIDTSSIQVLVDLNNDTDFTDPGEDVTASSTITTTQISYTPNSELTAGKHTVRVIVQDIAGNSAQTDWSFWLDDFTMTVENAPAIQLISGVQGETTTDSEHAKVTITTYGAGITLKGYMALLTSGGNTLPNWDGSTGIGWDVKEDAGPFTSTISAMGNTLGAATTLATKAKLADGTFSSQTYTFYVKISGDVSAIQQAGVYQNDLKFLLDLEY